jgi:hypothetical protein
MKSNMMHEKMSRRVIIESLKSNYFMPIDEVVERLRAANYYDEDAKEEAIANWEKTLARRVMRQTKDPKSGRPLFANLELISEDGEVSNGYMQEILFEPSHYRQVISYHVRTANHHINEAREYATNLEHRYGEQFLLPFPEPEEIRKAA